MYNEYFVFGYESFNKWPLRKIVEYSDQYQQKIWSARLSTGLFGHTDCASGNRGPKGINEVILGFGDDGLRKIVDLGFITCPTCKPETYDKLWDKISDIVEKKYGIKSLEEFTDKKILGFDARRICWEDILSTTKTIPNRIYLPKGLSNDEIIGFKKRFDAMNQIMPTVGYYDYSSPTKFTEYTVK